METFRCPTCISVLPDPRTRRCPMCGEGLRRRHPRVLGEDRRLAASVLPVDRFLLDRLHAEPGRLRGAAPVAGRATPIVAPRPVVAHRELEPEVRALIDELYEQARIELSGNDAPRAESSSPAPPRSRPGWSPAFVRDEPERPITD